MKKSKNFESGDERALALQGRQLAHEAAGLGGGRATATRNKPPGLCAYLTKMARVKVQVQDGGKKVHLGYFEDEVQLGLLLHLNTGHPPHFAVFFFQRAATYSCAHFC